MQGQLNVWDNIANYKKCRKKSYEIHVCMPPKNTIVINKLEQYDTYVALGKKDHFTADEVGKMQTSNPQMLVTLQNLVSQGKAYAVTQNTPFVLAGTIGEMWCISPDKLVQTYMFLQGGQPVAINQQSLQSRMKNGLMDWTLIRTSQQAQQGMNMACFVPIARKGQIKASWGSLLNINGAGVPHGKGDFVLCDILPNGQPNLANRWVVNGEVFTNTYDNHGWNNCLNLSGKNSFTIDTLPKLIPNITTINDVGVDPNVFKQKCDSLMKELQKVYKFNIKSNNYKNVKDYTGFAYEINFSGDCYVADYIVEGNFSHTYSVKDKATGGITDKTVTATETCIRFGCSATHSDSAIAMSIKPITNGLYLSGWAFPNDSNTKGDDYWSCKNGTISGINCAEEVKLFELKCDGRDVFIDNRKSLSKSPLDDVYDTIMSKHNQFFGGHISERLHKGMNDKNERILILSFAVDALKATVEFSNDEFIFSDVLVGSTKSKDDAVSFIIEGLGVVSKGMFSCFSAPKLSSTTFNSFVQYSSNDYKSLNKGLYEENLSFEDFMFYCDLHSFISRCRITGHITLFRGVEFDVKENSVISCNSFLSTSFSIEVADSFGIAILRIRDVYGLCGFFLNSISEYRNQELEVLMDAGYDIHVGKVAYKYFNKPVYDCYLTRNNSANRFTSSNYNNPSQVYIEGLYSRLISDSDIANKCIMWVINNGGDLYIRIDFESVKNSKIYKLLVGYVEGKLTFHALEKGEYDPEVVFKDLEPTSENTEKIVGYIKNICATAGVVNSGCGKLVYNQVAQKFTDNGFLVITDNVGSNIFDLVLSGDNDDRVVVKFVISEYAQSYKIKVSGRSNNNSINKIKEFETLQDLVDGVYKLIVISFKLNAANRCDKVLGLISNYLNKAYHKTDLGDSTFEYCLGDKIILAKLEGSDILYTYNGKSVLSNHFDNIIKVASNVYDMLKEGM